MIAVDCPVCDYQVQINPEAALADHLSGHSSGEVLEALAKADAYITQLEDENTELTEHVRALLTQALELAPGGAVEPVLPIPASLPQRSPQPLSAPLVDPDTTLIPLIPTDRRPPGVVGRKS